MPEQKKNKYIMLLNEFLYFNDTNNLVVDKRYNNDKDSSVLSRFDKRKIRLTLRQINQLRLQAEAQEAEKQSELALIKKMYGNPVESE